MNNEDLCELADSRIDGGLAPDVAAAFDRHLEHCAACRDVRALHDELDAAVTAYAESIPLPALQWRPATPGNIPKARSIRSGSSGGRSREHRAAASLITASLVGLLMLMAYSLRPEPASVLLTQNRSEPNTSLGSASPTDVPGLSETAIHFVAVNADRRTPSERPLIASLNRDTQHPVVVTDSPPGMLIIEMYEPLMKPHSDQEPVNEL